MFPHGRMVRPCQSNPKGTRRHPQRNADAFQPQGTWSRASGSTRSKRSTASPAPDHGDDRASAPILTRNNSPDISFDRSVNAYRGCEHGCIYCFARPTHAFHDLSPGIDFEIRLFAKPNAPQLLHAALSRPGYECRADRHGHQHRPLSADRGALRASPASLIELLLETRHPFTITTKSDRVLRDLDLLKPKPRTSPGLGRLSVTSLDPAIARTLEPRAPAPAKRLAAIKALNDAGVPCYVAIAPVVPQITDHELEAIVEAAAAAGATGGFYLPVRLPHEVAPLFRAWLDEHFPDRAAKVMATINSLRGGRDNDPNFFSRMRGKGPWADLLRTRFEKARSVLACPRRGSSCAPTCSARPKARRCGCCNSTSGG